MGINDRDYYRDSTRHSGWLTGQAPTCKALILANVAVFIVQAVFPEARLSDTFAASPEAIFGHGRVWQLLTATFLHDDSNPFHLIFNMSLLWMVGREVEAIYNANSRREFLYFYLTAAVLSTLGWATLEQFGPAQGRGSMVGASGAITAVMVVYTLYNPHRELTLMFVLPVEMWMLLVLTLGLDLMFLYQSRGGGSPMGIAFASHLVGGAYGYLYRSADLRYSRLLRRNSRPRLRVVQAEPDQRDTEPSYSPGHGRSTTASPASRPSPLLVQPDEDLDARLDEVLRKINVQGSRDNLTDEEKSVLEEASRRARDRRADRVR